MNFVITDTRANADDLLALLVAAEVCGAYVGYPTAGEGVLGCAARYLPIARRMLLVLDQPRAPHIERQRLLESLPSETGLVRVIFASPPISTLQRVYRPQEHRWLEQTIRLLKPRQQRP